jgi:hypothetical protein
MTIQYQLTLDDFVEAYGPVVRKRAVGLKVLLGIYSLFCLFIAVSEFSRGKIFFPFFMLFCGFLVPYTSLYQKIHLKKLWTNNQHLAWPHRMTADNRGAVFQTTHTRHEISWQAYKKHVETPHLFLLYLSNQGIHIVPKRVFADESQVNEFRALLRNIGTNSQQPPLPEP